MLNATIALGQIGGGGDGDDDEFPMMEYGTMRLLFRKHSNTSIISIFYSKNQ